MRFLGLQPVQDGIRPSTLHWSLTLVSLLDRRSEVAMQMTLRRWLLRLASAPRPVTIVEHLFYNGSLTVVGGTQ